MSDIVTTVPADAVFLLTGLHPDIKLLYRAGVRVDPATLVPMHDPEMLETIVPGLFLAASVVSDPETNRVFIKNSRLHGAIVMLTILQRIEVGRSRSGVDPDRGPIPIL